MNHQTTARSVPVTAALLVTAAILWAAVAVVLVAIVPSYERGFQDQNQRLPVLTQWTVAAGHWAGNYWYVLPAFGLVILPVVLVLSWLVRHRATSSTPQWGWFGALLGVPVLLQVGAWLALLLA